jgi:DNA-binding beta-propeller fold protein YncE
VILFKMKINCVFLTSVIGALLVSNWAQAQTTYSIEKEIAIAPDGSGKCVLAVDQASHRLFVAGDALISVVDVGAAKTVGVVTNAPGGFGFAGAFSGHVAYWGDAAKSGMRIIDTTRFKQRGFAKTEKPPGLLLYQPRGDSLIVFGKSDASVSIYEADDADFMRSIALPGVVVAAAPDAKSGLIYAVTQDAVVSIAPSKKSATNSWPVAPGVKPTGIAVDSSASRLFVACANKTLVLMNSTNGAVAASIAIGEGNNSVAFDPATRLVFSCCESGGAAIIREDPEDKLTAVATLDTPSGARASALDLASHKFYVAVPGATETRILVYGSQKPANPPAQQ